MNRRAAWRFMVSMAAKGRKRKNVRRHSLSHIPSPDGFSLVIDTREQKPLFDNPPAGLTIVRKALKHGDYSVAGYEDRVCIERKQLSDFYAYIGRERTKTKAKVKALSGMYWAALIIEATDMQLEKPYAYGKLTPEHARGFLLSLRVRHGVHTYITLNRRLLERYVLENLVKAYQLLEAEHE